LTTAPLAFIDTETTGINHGRRAWEVAIIRREPDGTENTFHAFIVDVDLSEADPYGLKVGRFYDRHPSYNGTVEDMLSDDPWSDSRHHELPGGARILTELDTAVRVERMTRGAHLVGAVPNFAEVSADMLRRHQLVPAWHYHLIDVENLAVGYLARKVVALTIGPRSRTLTDVLTPPWSSDELSRACGVEPASDDERHTALGDARWAMRLYDAIVTPAAAQ
jgi:hypothetical protein